MGVGRSVIEWFRYRLYFSRAVVALLGLVFAHGLVQNAVVDVLITYLTSDWETNNLRKSAAIVNIQEAVTIYISLFMAHATDAIVGRFKMVSYTTPVYILGLFLFWISTFSPSVKANAFYPTLFLIAVGNAGQEPTLKSFLADQLKGNGNQNIDIDDEQVQARTTFWWRVAKTSGALVSAFFMESKTWRQAFIISAIVMGIAYLLLWLGKIIASYNYIEPCGSPITKIGGVMKAAIGKRHLPYPALPSGYLDNDRNEMQISPRHRFMRWIDKAAIEASTGTTKKVVEVKEAKGLLTMLPLWATLLMYGLIQATGSTFFVEQSQDMKPLPHISIYLLLIFQTIITYITSFLYGFLVPDQLSPPQKQVLRLVRIGVGLVFSALSCLVAWKVEFHRLELVEKRTNLGITDEQDLSHKMSILWLTLEFALLGLSEGLVEEGISEFYDAHVDESMRLSDIPFGDIVLVVGKFFNVICVLIFKKWFGETLNDSRLDRYCRMLAFLSAGNLIFYVFVSYKYMPPRVPRDDPAQNPADLPPTSTSLEQPPRAENTQTDEELQGTSPDLNFCDI